MNRQLYYSKNRLSFTGRCTLCPLHVNIDEKGKISLYLLSFNPKTMSMCVNGQTGSLSHTIYGSIVLFNISITAN